MVVHGDFHVTPRINEIAGHLSFGLAGCWIARRTIVKMMMAVAPRAMVRAMSALTHHSEVPPCEGARGWLALWDGPTVSATERRHTERV